MLPAEGVAALQEVAAARQARQRVDALERRDARQLGVEAVLLTLALARLAGVTCQGVLLARDLRQALVELAKDREGLLGDAGHEHAGDMHHRAERAARPHRDGLDERGAQLLGQDVEPGRGNVLRNDAELDPAGPERARAAHRGRHEALAYLAQDTVAHAVTELGVELVDPLDVHDEEARRAARLAHVTDGRHKPADVGKPRGGVARLGQAVVHHDARKQGRDLAVAVEPEPLAVADRVYALSVAHAVLDGTAMLAPAEELAQVGGVEVIVVGVDEVAEDRLGVGDVLAGKP